ncbi:hypothetical protein NDU88_004116 [Pleurodeles waltl]|uniref:Uncharacterized protein n=1 Tax=Pleurodeles waltl TaxID=8319 RepID=A0AAV7PBJ7_PLEWA|nr:hypothetical protein NDU88_004116 [Pleurodeles waltl]
MTHSVQWRREEFRVSTSLRRNPNRQDGYKIAYLLALASVQADANISTSTVHKQGLAVLTELIGIEGFQYLL